LIGDSVELLQTMVGEQHCFDTRGLVLIELDLFPSACLSVGEEEWHLGKPSSFLLRTFLLRTSSDS
jgi:hypothetical protein